MSSGGGIRVQTSRVFAEKARVGSGVDWELWQKRPGEQWLGSGGC